MAPLNPPLVIHYCVSALTSNATQKWVSRITAFFSYSCALTVPYAAAEAIIQINVSTTLIVLNYNRTRFVAPPSILSYFCT